MNESQIKVFPCQHDPGLFKCPRCWHWHPNRFNTEYPPDKPDEFAGRHRFCNRCEEIMVNWGIDGGTHEAALKCHANAIALDRIDETTGRCRSFSAMTVYNGFCFTR